MSHSTTVTFTVIDFNISASPSSVALGVGGTGSSTITISSVNGFASSVNLSSSVSPHNGLACSLSPTSISSSGTSALSCSASSSGSFTVTVTGASGSLSHSTTVTFNASNTDFSVTASPISVAANAGNTGVSTITISPMNGFTGTVTLASSVSPTGLGCGLSPAGVVLGGSQTSTLSCSGPDGNYTVTVAGTSGSLSHSAIVTYNITGPDFSIAASPSAVTMSVGSTGTSTITVAPVNGFTGTVAMSSSSSPGGLSCGFNPASVVLGGSQSSTLSCSGSSGVYSVSVGGTSGSLSHSTTVTFTFQDFTVTATPTSLSLSPGGLGNSTIVLASMNGFAGTVSLSLSLSNGLTASLSSVSVFLASGGTASSTLTVSAATIGNYTASVTGTNGSISHSISIPVVVSDFSIVASPTALSLSRSSTISSLITLTSMNTFNGKVTFSVAISPSGPKASLSTATITLTPNGSGTSTLTVKALKRTPIGSYIVTIIATSGSLSHTIAIPLTVTG